MDKAYERLFRTRLKKMESLGRFVNPKNGYAQSKICYHAAESAEICEYIALGVLIAHDLSNDGNYHGDWQEKPIRVQFGF
jgi:hypothetical protein